jgi:hypothetical protein
MPIRSKQRHRRARTYCAIALACALATASAAASAADDPSSPLAPGYPMPEGYTKLVLSKQRGTGLVQIDAVYAPAGANALHFTALHGPKGHTHPGRVPIDVCVRDESSGEVVVIPQLSGAKALIEGCSLAGAEAASAARAATVLDALSSLAKVRFKPEYRSEYIAILNVATSAAPPDQALMELGNGVVVHERRPGLPPAARDDPAPAPHGETK